MAGSNQGWFQVTAPAPGVYAIAEPLHDEHVLSYLVLGDQRAALIDTGMGIGDIAAVVRELTALPVIVLDSHSHFDHIGGNWQFADIAIHRLEADRLPLGRAHADVARWVTPDAFHGPMPPGFDAATYAIAPSVATRILEDGDTIDLGGRTLTALHCPGHSPGGLAFHDATNGLLFSADVAYPAALYAHTPDCHWGDYRRSMARLAELAPALRLVLPSHNADSMSPALLVAMRDAFVAVDAGRTPDEVGDGALGRYERHRFDGFSLLAPSAVVRSAQS